MEYEIYKKNNILRLILSLVSLTLLFILLFLTPDREYDLYSSVLKYISIVMLFIYVFTSIRIYIFHKNNPYIVIDGEIITINRRGIFLETSMFRFSDIQDLEIDSSPVMLIKTNDRKEIKINFYSISNEAEEHIRELFKKRFTIT